MASPEQYWHRIKELGLDHMEIQVSTVSEAKETLKHIRKLQKELRQIKKNINLDMKAIRALYSQKISTAASTTSGILSLFGKRKLAGQLRADERRRLRMERDRTLQPYESLKLTIDDLLIQMDAAKERLQMFIEKAKSQSESDMRSSTDSDVPKTNAESDFCPQCGTPIEKSDKFCRNCGHKLR